MWAYALTAPRHFEKVEVPTLEESQLKEGQVLLRTLSGGICGSDLPAYLGHGGPRTQFQGTFAPNYPGYPMHEIVGEVLESRSPLFSPGSHVVGWATDADAIASSAITDGDGLAELRRPASGDDRDPHPDLGVRHLRGRSHRRRRGAIGRRARPRADRGALQPRTEVARRRQGHRGRPRRSVRRRRPTSGSTR